MAGIEKICEFSGDYPGSKMYKHKRNHIQICPQYRKLFRGAEAELVIVRKELHWYHHHGWSMSYYKDANWIPRKCKLKTEYWYELRVKDAHLRGQVEGKYLNWSYDLKDVVKRLKRMLRCRNLKIKTELED